MNLTPEQRSFVDAVVRPLGEDDSRRELLEESLVLTTTLTVPPEGDPVEVACARMEATAGTFPFRLRLTRTILVVALLAVLWLTALSPTAASSFRTLLMSMQATDSLVFSDLAEFILGDEGDQESAMERQIVARIPADERLVALGDLSASGPLPRWKAVWDAHPGDPAHFMAYADEVRAVTGRWHVDLVETGEKLDPGNGWFRLLGAAACIKDAVEPAVRGRSSKAGAPAAPAGPLVKDPAVLAGILSELERVVSLPRLDDYQRRLNAERLRAWPAPVDYPDQVLSMHFRSEHPEVRMAWPFELRSLGDLFSAAADQAATSGDKPSLDRIAALFQKTFTLLAGNPELRYPGRMAGAEIVEGSWGLSSAYARLGDSSKALAFTTLADGLDPRKARRVSPPPDALTEGRGSRIASNIGYYSGLPGTTPVSERELRGARLAEYAMAERFLFHGVTLFFGLALAVVLLLALRHSESSGLLGARLAGLLTGFDWLVIALSGIALPGLIHVGLVHGPWSRSRDFMIVEWRFSIMVVQLSALWVAVILCTVQAIRWRLGRRGAVLALGWHGFDPGWWLVPMSLSAIPVAEYLPAMFEKWSVDEDWMIAALWLPVVLPFAWLIVLATGHLWGSVERRLHRAIVLRALAPLMALAMILAAMAIPLLHRVEKGWTRQIDFDAVVPERLSFETRLDIEHANWLQAEQLRHLRELE
jgi:hypothetical protein